MISRTNRYRTSLRRNQSKAAGVERHEATSRRLQQLLAEIDPPDSAYREESTTDEQQSGRTADAVRRLQEELTDRYSKLSDAEGKLSEVLLNAKATTVDGQQKLNEIQAKIVEAINNPALSLDTPAGEQAFLKFLRSQVAAIGDVLQSGTLTAEDQSKAIAVIAVGFSNPAGAVVGVKEVDVDAAGGARRG